MATIHEDVQNYYSQQRYQSSDLKTDACCSKAEIPSFIKTIVQKIHPEVLARWVWIEEYILKVNLYILIDIMDVA